MFIIHFGTRLTRTQVEIKLRFHLRIKLSKSKATPFLGFKPKNSNDKDRIIFTTPPRVLMVVKNICTCHADNIKNIFFLKEVE